MIEKIGLLWPEITLFITTCVVMVLGLSPNRDMRRFTPYLAGFGLVISGVLALNSPQTGGLLPNLMPFAKASIAVVGLLLLMLAVGTVDRRSEELIAASRMKYNALRSNTAEFYAFFLFSLTGAMLCATADDLIWLFLALELTSLPTYVMVTISRRGNASQEAGVKYFFLGALGAAVFLYGFALLYGSTGSTRLAAIYEHVGAHGLDGIMLAGMILALIGVSFKIAAVPMHFYTADVYEGGASSVSAFLAFVPKTAGFITIILLVSALGWRFDAEGGPGTSLPHEVRVTLWVMAALTMTIGNVLALLQSSVKRILAYSSIAHSGYMLVGVVAGPQGDTFTSNGLAAVLFYLVIYGITNVGAFGVMTALERRAATGDYDEIESVDDLRGLYKSAPLLAWTMVICSMSLLGLPPLVGFFGKLPLFTSGVAAGEILLVVILGINSAIAAFYYLRLAAAPLLQDADPNVVAPKLTTIGSRTIAVALSAVLVVLLSLFGNVAMKASNTAAMYAGDGAALHDDHASVGGHAPDEH